MKEKKTYKCTNVKFCIDDPIQNQAWEYLHSSERSKGSFGKIISLAIDYMINPSADNTEFIGSSHIDSDVKNNNAGELITGTDAKLIREIIKETLHEELKELRKLDISSVASSKDFEENAEDDCNMEPEAEEECCMSDEMMERCFGDWLVPNE